MVEYCITSSFGNYFAASTDLIYLVRCFVVVERFYCLEKGIIPQPVDLFLGLLVIILPLLRALDRFISAIFSHTVCDFCCSDLSLFSLLVLGIYHVFYIDSPVPSAL